MKKLLLGSTMLVGAALASGAVQAQSQPNPVVTAAPFTVTIKTQAESTFVNLDETKGAATAGAGSPQSSEQIRFRQRIVFDGSATADNGLKYGFRERLQLGGGGGNGVTNNRSWGYVEGSFGTVTVGFRNSVIDDMMGFYGQAPSSASWFVLPGGYEEFGPYGDFITDAIHGMNGTAGGGPMDERTSHNVSPDTGNKLVFESKSFNGFQFGFSWTPNDANTFTQGSTNKTILGGDMGTGVETGHLQTTGFHDWIQGVVAYNGNIGPVGIGAGLSGQFASTKQGSYNGRAVNDASGVGSTLTLAYGGFGLGFTLNDDFQSGYEKRLSTDKYYKAKDQIAGSVGLVYNLGPYNVGVWYTASTDNGDPTVSGTNTYHVVGVKGTYAIAKGLDIYAGYENVGLKSYSSAVVPKDTVNGVAVGFEVGF